MTLEKSVATRCAKAVASAIAWSPFADVPDLGGTQWELDMIKAPEVWAQGFTGQGVTVAVLDTGVDYTHPDLQANIWQNPGEIAGNGLDDDQNGFVDDIRGWSFVDDDSNDPMDSDQHGTHVAGTIAAGNNGFGVTGVAYDAKIMPIRVIDGRDDNYPQRFDANVAAGIRYAVQNGARVINMSLGNYIGDPVMVQTRTALQEAFQAGVVAVMASGNERQEGATRPIEPAYCRGCCQPTPSGN
jgi:subtilisin